MSCKLRLRWVGLAKAGFFTGGGCEALILSLSNNCSFCIFLALLYVLFKAEQQIEHMVLGKMSSLVISRTLKMNDIVFLRS